MTLTEIVARLEKIETACERLPDDDGDYVLGLVETLRLDIERVILKASA